MARPPRAPPFFLPLFLFFFSFFLLPFPSQSAQLYLKNAQLNCSRTGSSVFGYSCSPADSPSCSSFFTFRPQTNYQTPAQIARLLSADPLSIARINRRAADEAIPLESLVLVPIACGCVGGQFYQANASYTIQRTGETYFAIANDTFQGLSTCQALIAQNPSHDSLKLFAGVELVVPLRCACPSRNQSAAGAKFLLSYLITWGDTIEKIAPRFQVKVEDVLDANSLEFTDTIYPFTTLLVPLPAEPSPTELISPPPPPPSPPVSTNPTGGEENSGSRKVAIGVGIGVGAAVLVISGLLAAWFWFCPRRRRRTGEVPPITSDPSLEEQILIAMPGSMTAYKFEDLNKATSSFSEENRINFSSVYRAMINGDVAAVKRTKEDVQNEINALNLITHSRIIRLSGFCHHKGDAFLVYEFAENGSLSDWLHGSTSKKNADHLDWIKRVRIACDIADALNYLHSCATPPLVHRNLKCSNILLDGEFRGKLGNFAMARAAEQGGGPAELTAHVVGTQGYLAPEYLEHGLVSTKLDVFAFGVVLIELISGKSVTEEEKDSRLTAALAGVLAGEDVREKLGKFMDACLEDAYPFTMAFAVAQLALRCVAEDYNSRPTSGEVLLTLTAIHGSSVDWDNDLSQSGSAVGDL